MSTIVDNCTGTVCEDRQAVVDAGEPERQAEDGGASVGLGSIGGIGFGFDIRNDEEGEDQ